MNNEYWQLIPEIEQLIAGQETQQAIRLIEKLLVEYGNLEHSLYLKGVCLEQEDLLMKNADALNQLAKAILAGDNSTITHLDKTFRWFYLTEDWDNCCVTLDSLLSQEAIPTSIPPGMYFKLAGPIRRTLIRGLLDAEHLHASMMHHPFILELKVLFQDAPLLPSHKHKKTGPVILLISDESIGDHFDAIQDQFGQLNYPVIVSNDAENGSPQSPSDLREWLSEVDPLAIFIQTPYLETLPKLWQQVISSQPFCIPGYGPNLSGDDFWWGSARGQFGLSGHVLARHVFAESTATVQAFNDCGISPNRVLLTGDPLSWSMRRNFCSVTENTVFDLLWAPHWAPYNLTGRRRGYRNIERDAKIVLQFAEAEQTVCLRAHPLLAKRMAQDSNFLTANQNSQHESLFKTWEELISHKNVTISSATMVEDCLRCTRLLTDGISIIFYWSLTGKPIAISSRPDSPAFATFALPLIAEIPKLLTEVDIINWLAGTSYHDCQKLIESCNEIIPDDPQSPIEKFLKFNSTSQI